MRMLAFNLVPLLQSTYHVLETVFRTKVIKQWPVGALCGVNRFLGEPRAVNQNIQMSGASTNGTEHRRGEDEHSLQWRYARLSPKLTCVKKKMQ